MGINLSFLPFFDKCQEFGFIKEPFVSFGSQEIHSDPDSVKSFADRHGYRELQLNPTVKNLFAARYGIHDYRDVDLNASAALHLDLGKPLAGAYHECAETVLNAGTLEHIFNIHQALENAHEFVKPGGCIIHIAPVTWYNHAFYNINPKLFASVAHANKYETLLEAFHFSADPFPAGTEGGQLLYFTHMRGSKTPACEQIDRLFSTDALPSNMLYMCALVKGNNTSFTIPYEIQD